MTFIPADGYPYASVWIQKIKDAEGNEVETEAENPGGKPCPKTEKDFTAAVNADEIRSLYTQNMVTMDFDDLTPGEYTLWATFKNEPGDAEARRSRDITLVIKEFPEKVTYNVTSATGDDSDGSIAVGDISDGYTAIRMDHDGAYYACNNVTDGKTQITDLAAGRYRMTLLGITSPATGSYLAGTYTRTMYSDNVTVSKCVPVTGIAMYPRAVPGMTIDPGETWTASIGQVFEVGCKVTPYYAYDTGYKLTSSDPKVVSVDGQGNIKALKKGEAVITAVSTGLDESGEPKVTGFKIIVDPNLKLKKIKNMKFTGKIKPVEIMDTAVYTSPGNTDNIIPLEITIDKEFDGIVKWTVSDTSIADFTGAYDTTPSQGKADAKLQFSGPGQVTVTATASKNGGSGEAYETRQISTTVTVDGLETDSAGLKCYIKDGHRLKGLVAFNSNGLVAAGNAALTSSKTESTAYADPATGVFVSHKVVTIGKKMYCFSKSAGQLLAKGTTDKDITIEPPYCINKKGELQTGWVKVGDKEYYFDPETGAKVGQGNWVPRGKGMTYIGNADGSFGPGTEGVVTIGDKTYCFDAKGMMLGGFVYFDNDGKITKASKAVTVQYYDPLSGVLVSDPVFTVGGKTYYKEKDSLTIRVNALYQGEDNKWHISDKTGAALKSQFVTYEGKTYYADETGCLLTSCNKVIKGKLYKFNPAGERTDTAGDALISTGYKVIEPGDEKRNVYLKQAKGSKPADGLVFYYYNGTENVIASDLWIYDNADEPHKIYHTDRNGRPVTGVMTFGEGWDKAVYFFEPDTGHIATTEGIKTYNKKQYLCKRVSASDSTIVVKTVDLVHSEEGPYFTMDPVSKKYVLVMDTKGTLATGITTYQGRKFIFDDDGHLLDGVDEPGDKYSSPVFYKGKIYLIEYSDFIEGRCIQTNKTGATIVKKKSNSVGSAYTYYAVNKDGTVKEGWVSANGKKYYSMGFFGLYSSNTDMWSSPAARIGGRLYLFSNDPDDPCVLTGWQVVDSGDEGFEVKDFGMMSTHEYSSGVYYFLADTKSGAVNTGFKKINAPELYTNGRLKLDANGVPVIGKIKKNVYFNEDESVMPMGALASNKDLTVGGKLYRFGYDGVAAGKKPGMTTVHDETDSYEAYVGKDGRIATGRTAVKVGGNTVYYYFDAKGRMEKEVFRKTGSKWYYYGRNGQMAFDPDVADVSSDFGGGGTTETVTAIFNKDGSLNRFVKYVNNKEQIVVNAILSYGTDSKKLQLDMKGKPATGYSVFRPVNGTAETPMVIAPDGSVRESEGYSIVKSGKKYYLTDGIKVQTDTTAGYVVTEYGSLSASEQKELDAYHGLMEDGPITVSINADGSLSSGRTKVAGKTIYKNKYGMDIFGYSLFAKSGSSWYVDTEQLAGTQTVGAYYLGTIENPMVEVALSYDAAGKLISAVDHKTGKSLNGAYMLSDFRMYLFKNGKPSGGKAKINIEGFTSEPDFEKDAGVARVIIK